MSVRKREWKTKSTGEAREAWVLDYMAWSQERGKMVRCLETFSRKKDADAREAQVTVRISEGAHSADSRKVKVEDAAKIWMKAVEVGRNGREPAEASTLRQYQSHLDEHILPELGGKKLIELTAPAVTAFRDHLLETTSRAMAKKVLTSFKSMLREAKSRGLMVIDPASTVSVQIGSRQKREIEIPARKDIKALLAKLEELATQPNAQRAKAWRRWRAVISTAIYTGCRASELRGAPWAAIDLKAATLTVRQRADETGEIGPPKSESGNRTINLPAALVATLRQWKAECPPGPLAFPNWQGRPESLANIHNRCWTPLQLAAGLSEPKTDAHGKVQRDKEGRPILAPKYNFHSVRHFHASQLIDDGANPKDVQVEMGHSTIAVTYDLYGHLFKDDEANQKRKVRAERLAAALT